MSCRHGFTLSLEAAASLLLLLSAASALSLYSFPRQQASDYYVCSDAAVMLSKTPQGQLEQALSESSHESGLCLQARLGGEHFSSGCQQEGKEKFTLHFPVWNQGAAEELSLSCSRP
jgi:hypothetical protein